MEMRLKDRVVGCGVQGDDCLALELAPSKGGKFSINWSLAGKLGDEAFASLLAKKTGKRHFWVSPSEEGGLQVESVKAIEIPDGALSGKGVQEDFFLTQIKSGFVNEEVVYGGLRMKGVGVEDGIAAKRSIHNVGGGAIKDNVNRDYANWYSKMGIRRPHIASTALALANAYLAIYPAEKRMANQLRLLVLKGRSVYRAVLMDGWKYIDEVVLPRMEGDDVSVDVIGARMQGWIEYLNRQHPELAEGCVIDPLVIAVKEEHVSTYEHWDLWGEYAMEKIDMTGETAEPILMNRDLAPIAFGMALQGGC